MFLYTDNGNLDTGLHSKKSNNPIQKALPTSSNTSIVYAGDYLVLLNVPLGFEPYKFS